MDLSNVYGIRYFKLTSFWRTNSYSLAFRFNWHSFKNQSYVSRNSKTRINEKGTY